MHQHPRPSPRSATPASNPTTNPERTNNPRDQPLTRTRSSVDLASYTERAGGDTAGMAARAESAGSGDQDRESTKLNQIIQHFHTKAALMVCSSRAQLPQVYAKNGEIRQNRWFNTVVDETDVLVEDLQEWRRPDLYQNRPSPMVIEIVLDATHVAQNQALVIEDDNGSRREIPEAPSKSASGAGRVSSRNGKKSYGEVVLERWTIELGSPDGLTSAELGDSLPNVYKKGIVTFRSLYTFLRFLPVYKLYRKLGRQPGGQHALRLKFRIQKGLGLQQPQHHDSLYTPFSPSEHAAAEVATSRYFESLNTRAGPLHTSVAYRNNCSFNIVEADTLLSSLLLNQDLSAIPTGRSLPGERPEKRREQYSSTAAPTTNNRERPRALLGAYGSLGTFHAPDKRGSPVSELRQRAIEGDEEDDDDDEMQRLNEIRAQEGLPPRREHPAFKNGSLLSPSPRPASSPRTSPAPWGPSPSPSPSTSTGKSGSYLEKYASGGGFSSKRTSLNALPQQQLRTPSVQNEVAVASSGSTSPKPAPVNRYSSSFANRQKRFTSQSSKAAESNTSSGRGSSSSKEKISQPNEGAAASSGSGRTEEDDIASFISDLERSRDVKFLHTPPTARDNVVSLAKYSSMRDPSSQLADEMSSSSLIQTSTTPPSRRLSNVPGLSTSSSPSRALTHAPHVPSRLSTHSIAEERTAASAASGASGEGPESPRIREEEEEPDLPFIFPHDNDQAAF